LIIKTLLEQRHELEVPNTRTSLRPAFSEESTLSVVRMNQAQDFSKCIALIDYYLYYDVVVVFDDL
jgi:hypothetical protein